MQRSLHRVFALMLLASTGLSAQHTPTEEEVFSWQFEIAAPDTGFTVLEGDSGWEEAATETKLIAMAAPFPYDQMASDFMALQSEDGQQIIERKQTEIGGVAGLLLILEFKPLRSADPEPTYSLMFVRPFEQVSLVLNALYPKSQHERLYPKMLAAFATVRKK